MIIKISFPHAIEGRQLVRDACEAIELGLPPEPLSSVRPHHVAAYFSQKQQKMISDAGAPGRKLSESTAEFAYALFQHRLRGKQAGVLPSRQSDQQEHQDRILEQIHSAMSAGQIVIGEASTGIGKSRIFAKAAEALIRSNKSNVVWLAAPSVSVVTHLAQEFQRWAPDIQPTLLLGRGNFVSEHAIREVVRELEAVRDEDVTSFRERLDEWLDAGAPPRAASSKRLASLVPGISHLYDDLLAIAPKMAQHGVVLSNKAKEGEPAEDVLSSMHQNAAEARVVICTHAMLLSKTSFLSKDESTPFTHLLVDEVHELEAWAAKNLSHELSLFRLRAWVRSQRISAGPRIASELTDLMFSLTATGLRDGRLVDEQTASKICSGLNRVHDALRRSRNIVDDEREEFLMTIRGITERNTTRIGVSFSPVRRYPSIFAGPVSVGGVLAALWARVKGAVGLSGTIFVPRTSDTMTAAYMLNKLAVPLGRARIIGPVSLRWNHEIPTLMVPAKRIVGALSYPGRIVESEDPQSDIEVAQAAEDYAAWIDATARAIRHAAHGAVGGTLVLCTAFADIESLEERLSRPLQNRLLAQRRGESVLGLRERFAQMHADGLRPVWMATGPAWTGLNLSDDSAPAVRDTLLTDLIILRAPIGLQRSSTQRTRRRAWGFLAEIFEASVILRQGIGRLVRRNGVQHRRLWILDGRIYSTTPTTGIFRSFRPILEPFPKKETFDLLTGERDANRGERDAKAGG